MNYFIHVYTSHHFTPHRKIWTQLIDLVPNAWLHSSVGRATHRYRGGHRFESRWSPDFFRLLSNCLNWKIYCDDHSSLSSTTAVHIWIISYKLHITKYHNFSVSRRSIICLSLQLQQIIDLLPTDRSRYFVQPRPIIVNHLLCNTLFSHDPLLVRGTKTNL